MIRYNPPRKPLIAECMGKYSNIILVDTADDRILESLKRVDETMSRYREVMPGETYVLPPQQEKSDPLTLDKAGFTELIGRQASSELAAASSIRLTVLARHLRRRSSHGQRGRSFGMRIRRLSPISIRSVLPHNCLWIIREPIAASPMRTASVSASRLVKRSGQ